MSQFFTMRRITPDCSRAGRYLQKCNYLPRGDPTRDAACSWAGRKLQACKPKRNSKAMRPYRYSSSGRGGNRGSRGSCGCQH